MDRTCLDHRMTADERRQFEENGYFVVKQALPPAMVESLAEAADGLYEHYGPDSGSVHRNGSVHLNGRDLVLLDAFGRDDRFLDLLDWPRTFPKVVDILGWNIQLYTSHLGVNPPLAEASELRSKRLQWHQDTGQLNRDIETSPRPRVSLKIGFFFTSTNASNRGCFHVIPGRHLDDVLELPDDETVEHPEAMPVMVDAGDAVFFDRRVWHAPGRNTSDLTRKVLFMGYSYRWLRPRDDMTVEHYLRRADPIRRQLLGACVTGGLGFSSPRDEDVPLKLWWAQHTEPAALLTCSPGDAR